MLIMSSQKTMPFAVSLIALFPPSLGSKGLLTLPPLVSQVSRIPWNAGALMPVSRCMAAIACTMTSVINLLSVLVAVWHAR